MNVLGLIPGPTGDQHEFIIQVATDHPVRPTAYRWASQSSSSKAGAALLSADMPWPGYDTAPSGLWVHDEREFVVELFTPLPTSKAELLLFFEDRHGTLVEVAVALPAVASLESHVATAAAAQLDASAKAASWKDEADWLPVGALKQTLAETVKGGDW